MPVLRGRPIRTNVKTMDDVRRALQGLDQWLYDNTEESPIHAKVVNSTLIAANRWRYTCVEQQYLGDGEYEDKDGGRTFTTCYNSCEAFNEADPSVRGNSVDSHTALDDPPGSYPAGFAMVPVRGYPVVFLFPQTISATGTIEYLFQYENAEQGPCDDTQANEARMAVGFVIENEMDIFDSAYGGW